MLKFLHHVRWKNEDLIRPFDFFIIKAITNCIQYEFPIFILILTLLLFVDIKLDKVWNISELAFRDWLCESDSLTNWVPIGVLADYLDVCTLNDNFYVVLMEFYPRVAGVQSKIMQLCKDIVFSLVLE